MTVDRQNIFGEIARIEKQADEAVRKAKAEAKQIREDARAEVEKIRAETDASIEQTRSELARDYDGRTEQALTQVDVEFLKQQEALSSVREERLDKLVEWTASAIREKLENPRDNGD
jgi:vacuolar-type H+-ATPase subunit H